MKKTVCALFAALCVMAAAPQAKADVLIAFPSGVYHNAYRPYYSPRYYSAYNAEWLRREELRREWLRAREVRLRQQEWRYYHHGWR